MSARTAAAERRLAAWAELEELTHALRELGWKVERLSLVDEEDQPQRAHLRVSRSRISANTGMI